MIGAVERGGQVQAKVIPDRKVRSVLPLVTSRIALGTTVYTDEAMHYNKLPAQGYEHHRIQHAAKVYVKGNVHTNTIEGFWMLLKTGILGTHHAVSPKYLQHYVNEYAFRYSHRKDDAPMFETMQERVTKVRHGRYGKYAPIGE